MASAKLQRALVRLSVKEDINEERALAARKRAEEMIAKGGLTD